MLPKKHRFSSRKEVSTVLKNCQRQYGQNLTLLSCVNPARTNQPWRLTVIVGKKSVSKLANRRNLVKRQLINAFYQKSKGFDLGGFDFCLISKRSTLTTDFTVLSQEISLLLSKFTKISISQN